MNNDSVNVKKPRKPRTKKIDMINKKEEIKVPKKRGRKPKGGKVLKNIDNNILNPTNIDNKKILILHLKCKIIELSDLNNINYNINYSPNIINSIEPYTVNEYYDISNNEDVKLLDDAANQDSDIEKSSNKLEQKNKKCISNKLKELEKNLNSNNIKKKSSCFWCTYDFSSQPIYIPSLYFKNKYDVYGCFCSPECACSYLFKENIDDNTKFERYQLLNYLYGSIYDYNNEIKLAPDPYYTLSKFYGNLTIQEYRQLLNYDRLLLVIKKPVTKIFPEIHEDNNNFETVYENKLKLKKNIKNDKNEVLNNVFSKL